MERWVGWRNDPTSCSTADPAQRTSTNAISGSVSTWTASTFTPLIVLSFKFKSMRFRVEPGQLVSNEFHQVL